MKTEIVKSIERAMADIEKDQPEPKAMLGYYQHELTDLGYRIVSISVLNDFFNSKSDANKYLDATQQEDLENKFHDYLLCI